MEEIDIIQSFNDLRTEPWSLYNQSSDLELELELVRMGEITNRSDLKLVELDLQGRNARLWCHQCGVSYLVWYFSILCFWSFHSMFAFNICYIRD